ncbi:hypothetical protein LLG10_06930 [bacterium]|nr:hypothetical protein [bacterium]
MGGIGSGNWYIPKNLFTNEWTKSDNGPGEGKGGTTDYGLFRVNNFWFEGASKQWLLNGLDFDQGSDAWKTNRFLNIGAGVGMIFTNIQWNPNNKGWREPLFFSDFWAASEMYNADPYHRQKVRGVYRKAFGGKKWLP